MLEVEVKELAWPSRRQLHSCTQATIELIGINCMGLLVQHSVVYPGVPPFQALECRDGNAQVLCCCSTSPNHSRATTV